MRMLVFRPMKYDTCIRIDKFGWLFLKPVNLNDSFGLILFWMSVNGTENFDCGFQKAEFEYLLLELIKMNNF